MTTEHQIEANRRNALKSTGPRTHEGKAIASQNALRHGLYASMPLHRFENSQEFGAFRDGLLACLKPRDPLESFIAHRLVANAWRLRRVLSIETALIERFAANQDAGDHWTFEGESEAFLRDVHGGRPIAHLNRYESLIERAFRRDLADYFNLIRSRKYLDAQPPLVADSGLVADSLPEESKPNQTQTNPLPPDPSNNTT